MKKPILSLLSMLLIVCCTFAQTGGTSSVSLDKLYMHSGQVLDVKVIKVAEFAVTYKFPGEDAEQVIGKLAVAKIAYNSGRTEEISEKIAVSGKDDWENVQILTDKAQCVGLKKGDEIRGKTSGMLSYNTAGSADKKASKKIKEAAAEAGAPFILLTSDKNDGFGIKQSVKNGVTYTYK